MPLPEVLALIRTFKAPLTTLFNDLSSDVDYLLDKGIRPYIESHLRKIKLTNTFLHRTEKVDFYNTFFPLAVTSGNKSIEADNNFVTNLWASLKTHVKSTKIG